jgi:hypothetical protein
VPAIAHRLNVPLRTIDPEPWSLGVRFREEPEGLHRFRVARGAAAVGSSLADLPCGEDAWVIFIIRHGQLVAARSDTRLEAGDEVLILADSAEVPALKKLFAPRRADHRAERSGRERIIRPGGARPRQTRTRMAHRLASGREQAPGPEQASGCEAGPEQASGREAGPEQASGREAGPEQASGREAGPEEASPGREPEPG